MIIDLIINRKDGAEYIPEEFCNSVVSCREVCPEFAAPLIEAMNHGSENEVKIILCTYIKESGFNLEICDYINSVEWIY